MESEERNQIFEMILSISKQRYKVYMQAVILTTCLITCIVHSLSLLTGVIFFLFQLLCVLIPGKSINAALKIEHKGEIAECAYAYGTGIIMFIPLYYICQALSISKYAWIISVVVALFSVFSMWKYAKRSSIVNAQSLKENSSFGWQIGICLIVLIYIVDFFTVSLANSLPNESSGTGYYSDWLFWVGNNISFMKKLPVQNFRLVGVGFNYHYFSSIVMAQISFMTGIDIVVLSFYYSYILIAVPLALISVYLVQLFTKSKVLIVSAIVAIFFTGSGGITTEWHYYFCPFGYDYGMLFGMLSVTYLLTRHQCKWNVKDILYSSVLLLFTTGAKAPVAVIILLGYGLETIYIFTKKRIREGLITGLFWSLSFVLIYIVFIRSSTRNISTTYYGLSEAFNRNPVWMELYENVKKVIPFSGKLAKIIAWLLCVIDCNRITFSCFFISLIVYAFNRKSISYLLLMLLSMTGFGIFLTFSFRMDGSSQIYFIMATLPYAICFSLPAMDKIFHGKKMVRKIIAGLIVCYTAAYSIGYWEARVDKHIWQGVETNRKELTVEEYQNKYSYAGYYVSKDLWEIYSWIKNNTDEDSIIAAHGGRGDLQAGVFSERYIWNDGTYCSAHMDKVDERNKIIEMLDDPNSCEEGIRLLKENNVAYYFEGVNPDVPSLLEEKLEKVYSNSIIAIYKIV